MQRITAFFQKRIEHKKLFEPRQNRKVNSDGVRPELGVPARSIVVGPPAAKGDAGLRERCEQGLVQEASSHLIATIRTFIKVGHSRFEDKDAVGGGA